MPRTGRFARLLDSLVGYGEIVRRQAGLEAPLRRWRPGGRRQVNLLDEQYLRRLERLSLVAQRSVRAGVIGEHPSWRKASSIEFADHRPYVAGDDFRRVDWNAYGRLDHLFVKLTEARQDVALHLLVDASASMAWGDPEKLFYAKQVAAALGYIALSRFDSVAGAALGPAVRDYLPVTRGQGQALVLFDFLNHVAGAGELDLEVAATAYCARTPQRGVAVVISDLLLTRGVPEGLGHLVKQGLETAVVHLLDAEELNPTLRGDVELVDLETGERIELTVGPEAIRSYERRVAEWCAEIEATCRKLGVKYLRIDTSQPFERMVVQYLRERRLVS